MSFQTPITIAEAVRRIQRQELVLPAIQRAFVWEEDQIARLFDSVLRGYPIGSFLSWEVQPDTAAQFRFYGFMREYHQKDNKYCPVLDVPKERAVVAVLDGQQRLTALNLGLRGSYASRARYARKDKATSYPKRLLYVNVLAEAPESELGMRYDFRMLTVEAAGESAADKHWFPVHLIFEISGLGALMKTLAARGLGNSEFAVNLVGGLFEAVHQQPALYFYEESDQEIDKVLDIFIRVNNGGSRLSHSDLLLSTATAQWDQRDARVEIQSLVDGLNATGQGFGFSKEVVLKSGLMLIGVADVGFKARNFNRRNMELLQDRWDEVSRALQLAANLLADFGLSDATLTARSVIIPVAYYAHRRGLDDTYRTSPSTRPDREAMQRWIIRALLKSGVWGSGLDTLLGAMRTVIDTHGAHSFPVAQIESQMASRGKGLTFTAEEITEMLDYSYGSAGTFPLLALLFPHVNTRNLHHVDHVYPRSLLTTAKLKKDGSLDQDARNLADWHRDGLANLQLLEGAENIAKKDRLPGQWARSEITDPAAYDRYLDINEFPALPDSVLDFTVWAEKRYELLGRRIAKLLDADWSLPADGSDQT